MKIIELTQEFTVCKAESADGIGKIEKPYFLSCTETENSLVCKSDCVPKNAIAAEDGWRGFYVSGTLDFSLVGILSQITTALANENIPVFAVSTFDTDYIFVKKENYKAAKEVLSRL